MILLLSHAAAVAITALVAWILWRRLPRRVLASVTGAPLPPEHPAIPGAPRYVVGDGLYRHYDGYDGRAAKVCFEQVKISGAPTPCFFWQDEMLRGEYVPA